MVSGKDKPKVAKGATLGRGLGPESYLNKTSSKSPRKGNSTVSERLFSINTKERKLDETNLPYLLSHLKKQGIETSAYKERYITRRIRMRMNRLNMSSYSEYLAYIKRNFGEISKIKESLSINVTRFFRNRDTFELVRDHIVPQITSNGSRKGSEIKIWSAGCAVGAEPYTISMIFEDKLRTNDLRLRILATDVNPDLLEIARHATYDGSYLSETRKIEATKYFKLTGEGYYKVNKEIRNRVNFSLHDLNKDTYPKGFDAIFCRNVLIYIDKQEQRRIIEKFVESLNPGGFLIIGRTETLFGSWKNTLKTISGSHRVYQKIGDVMAEPISVTPRSPSRIGVRNQKTEVTSKKSSRLNELKNFKEQFEERKKLWENRISRVDISSSTSSAASSETGSETSSKGSQSLEKRFKRNIIQGNKVEPDDMSRMNFQERKKFWEEHLNQRRIKNLKEEREKPRDLKSLLHSRRLKKGRDGRNSR